MSSLSSNGAGKHSEDLTLSKFGRQTKKLPKHPCPPLLIVVDLILPKRIYSLYFCMIINLFFSFPLLLWTVFQSLYIAAVALSSNASNCVSSDVKRWKTSILFDHADDDIHVGFDDKNACVDDDGNDQGKQYFGT